MEILGRRGMEYSEVSTWGVSPRQEEQGYGSLRKWQMSSGVKELDQEENEKNFKSKGKYVKP